MQKPTTIKERYLYENYKLMKKEVKRLRKALIKLSMVSLEAAETDTTLRVKKL